MEKEDELLQRIAADEGHADWLRDAGTVIAAVSGGPDSMALLHMLLRMAKAQPFRLIAAHVNHRFRGAESDAEAKLVAQTAENWGIPLEAAAIDVPLFIEETGMNAQAAARQKRYEFLLQTAARHGAGHLLLGHHADDQAETVLMRVLRGTGVSGLAGIPYRRKINKVELIRPLLRITKGELLAYCERNGVPYALDSSNGNRHYFRNVVRLDLLPMLEGHNPRLKESLIRLADLAASDDDYLESEAARFLDETAIRSGEGFQVVRRRFGSFHIALQRRMIKLILKCCANGWQSLAFQQIEAILEAMNDNSAAVTRLDVGGGWVFVREYDKVYIGPPQPEQRSYCCRIAEFPCALAPGNGWFLQAERAEGAVDPLPDNRWEARFDESSLSLPLAVRTRRPGDRLEPSGLNGTKKVQDMFVDAKIPRSERDGWPLIADAQERILWIPGLRRSRLALTSADTRKIVRIRVQHPGLRVPDRSDT